MALTKEFIDAVLNSKITRVRIMLKDIMLVDPSLNTFDEMLVYAEKNMSGLFDEHDGEKLKKYSTDWTQDYMNQQMVSVVTNFSKERIAVLKDIVKHLYGNKVKSENENIRKTTPSVSISRVTGMQIAGGVVTVVGTGALVVGIIKSNIPVAVVGGIAVASGVVLVLMGGKKEA